MSTTTTTRVQPVMCFPCSGTGHITAIEPGFNPTVKHCPSCGGSGDASLGHQHMWSPWRPDSTGDGHSIRTCFCGAKEYD